MEYEMQAKPFEGEFTDKYRIIQITNFAYHTNMPDKSSVGKVIRKAFKFKMNNESRIIAAPTEESITNKKAFVLGLLKNDPEFIKLTSEYERDGYKILLQFPNDEIPSVLGQDAVDTIAKIDKNNRVQIIHKGSTLHSEDTGIH